MLSRKRLSDPKALLTAAASFAATAMLIRSVANDFIPIELRSYFFSRIGKLCCKFSSTLIVVIDEFQGHSTNKVFEAVDAYLGTKVTPYVRRIKVSKGDEDTKLTVTADRDEEIVDVYEDLQVSWILVCTEIESSGTRSGGDNNSFSRLERKAFELKFHQKHREKVLNSYLPYILERAKAIKEEIKAIKLHTVVYGSWDSNAINLDHPMSFKTLAMDPDLKMELMDDLNNFVEGKEFHRRTGKAWKRGYLLYGPPGTGKSSLIAAMANHLSYDIYDLDLTSVRSNCGLRSLLLGMSNRSILVIEDIDCTINLQNRESSRESGDNSKNQVTLSGLLNFIDGLWSCCGEERIIVFTTNHKDRLDPALLRPGRMDMHIHMSYCNFSGFKQLTFNYHGISQHQLFEEIEGLIGEVKVTPAEVAGELMKNKDAEVSLQGLIKFLQNKKTQPHDKAETDKDVKGDHQEGKEKKDGEEEKLKQAEGDKAETNKDAKGDHPGGTEKQDGGEGKVN
ncbi:AAA-ATPase At3g50940-like [Juglans microcarpa x Juglans regia]|uniref:AAA-ATPase At3g50940-like n=1 Tax=Juglans microcarpa x Juglans regia TaxID=2249226 RepID=UPI001B7F2BAA|nr:AAA-ATPase At3g50940-like [Juglans microcarpa x Juglans regia]